ncbi:alanine--tRNA ligase [Buchnera aphidicola]|uniref:Alanine--tRNA ligase n=1 Tax=Buchnera aphidicola subsp. Cinara cedri (strain Cc) TaxID=372461 RepID=SYA_BUCCC|nr:alanine--tRNA ligase [Buchnera aphidicola]Q057H8.1 RecName: Full=Alanine--tRNA ligase; AltName: Full=Alanyl-tRNA synthetase; Short=AlaRS [Buchnera aphidicola BCc]ABJ90721.1 alanyl-tRNA synthetase [Buchnera aphidicola BCc]
MKTDKIRAMFLQFFKEKNHKIFKSSSLIPKDDNSLLFTNAGMNQFKKIYLKNKKKNQLSIATSQYCIRTGGKHDDLKKVGHTPYHHTLFEMLGNFSFGEYFKENAIKYAWEFLTHKKWLNLSKKKIWITYYYNDNETKKIWLNIIKIKNTHLIKIYDKKNIKYNSDNFWKMGDLGPCGPSTEIFYYQKKNRKEKKSIKSYKELEKYCLEIWNLVFMEFNQITKKKIIKLPIPSIDTGMGLERISVILQNVKSIFHTNNFIQLIEAIKKKIKIKIKKKNNVSLKIISDHIRTSTCLIAENILPGNEGRNYVLRKIIRRALCHGYFIGLQKPFFYKLSELIIYNMKKMNYDFHIQEKIHKIKKILFYEEKQFYYILENGLQKLKKIIKNIKKNKICEQKIFTLYDTYGLPIQITQKFCKKKNISFNINKLNLIIKNNKKKQKNKEKKKKNFSFITFKKKSIFDGYHIYEKKSKIIQIIYKNKNVLKLSKSQLGIIILDITPFFSKSSGQIGDSGKILNDKGIFIVQKTKKFDNYILHIGYIKHGCINIKDIVHAKINKKKRKTIQSNHSATHLLNAALCKIFSEKIIQKGSFINDKYLRFDFFCNKTLTEEKINYLENIINKKIQKNIPINFVITSFKKAKKKKIKFLLEKKYKKTVRIIYIKNFSIELCNGTHHDNTGKIGCFKIIAYNNIGNEIKRITAITGMEVIQYFNDKDKINKKLENLFSTNIHNIYLIAKNIVNKNKKLLEENIKLKNKNIIEISKILISKAYLSNKKFLIIEKTSYIEYKLLRKLSDILKEKLKSLIVILINDNNKKINFLISITKNLKHIINLNNIKNIIFSVIPGTGGGKKTIIEGKFNIDKIHLYKIDKIKKKIIKYINKYK